MPSIVMSMGEHTHFGNSLFKFWYYNSLLQDLMPGLSGCPHNGGEHTCTIRGERDELLTSLELFEECYPETKKEIGLLKDALNDGVDSLIILRKVLRDKAPYLNWVYVRDGRFIVKGKEDVVDEAEVSRMNFAARRKWLTSDRQVDLETILIGLLKGC